MCGQNHLYICIFYPSMLEEDSLYLSYAAIMSTSCSGGEDDDDDDDGGDENGTSFQVSFTIKEDRIKNALKMYCYCVNYISVMSLAIHY